MITRNLLTIVLLAAALGSWWLYRQAQTPATAPRTVSEHEPDYFFEDFVVTAVNEQGQPKHRMRGTRMMHYVDDDTTELEDPELEIFTAEAPDWTINSERGWISSGGDQVLLDGEVEILRDATSDRSGIRARTRDVRIQPDEEYAETAEAVVITSDQLVVKAVGMRAFIGEDRVELLSQVDVVHDSK